MPTQSQAQDKSVKWFQDLILGFASNATQLEKKKIGKILAKPKLGRLCHYWYDPKLKATLPYYDRFPLCVPLNYYDDGFLGLNIHYLPPQARLAFFDQLMTVQSKKGFFDKLATKLFGKNYDLRTKININYLMLRDTNNFNGWEACIKRYLYGHVRSPFLDIEPKWWEEIVMLPVQKFVKGSPW